MRKEVIIRMQLESDKCQRKALKVAASVRGVESVSVTGPGNELLRVIGDVDDVELTEKLREKVGAAETVELRTLPGDALLDTDVVVLTQSPYQHWRHSTPGGGRVVSPVSAAAWQQADYYPRTPSPPPMAGYGYAGSPLQYHYPSPVAGQAGYGYAGSRDALVAACSHPASYSPMIARHDYRAVGRPRAAGRGHGGGPNCCSIL